MSNREAQYRDGNPTYEVVSKSSGNTYYLSKNSTAAKNADQEWSCSCMAWIIQKKRPCKHLIADKRTAQVVNTKQALKKSIDLTTKESRAIAPDITNPDEMEKIQA